MKHKLIANIVFIPCEYSDCECRVYEKKYFLNIFFIYNEVFCLNAITHGSISTGSQSDAQNPFLSRDIFYLSAVVTEIWAPA